MKKIGANIIYSPADLIRYLESPFSSWMDRCYLEDRASFIPDKETEDQKLIFETGYKHENRVLSRFKDSTPGLIEIPTDEFEKAKAQTSLALIAKPPIIFQAALDLDQFAGYADFLILDSTGKFQVWDTKLAHSPKPYYIVQLCCYSEMLAAATGDDVPNSFGVILGNDNRVEFRVKDFIDYYRRIKSSFLKMQENFVANISQRPEPLPRADHGRWTSHAESFFTERDHLVRVAGISVGQIKKLSMEGIRTLTDLAGAGGRTVRKLADESLKKLVAQARLQKQTLDDRKINPAAKPRFEILASRGKNGEPVGLAKLPPPHFADVYFDMEGFPLVAGGLEYLFGASTKVSQGTDLEFHDWWAHDRAEEKQAFEQFVDWVHARWLQNPEMHIYHYAAYEVSAIRRLSTRHDSRQDEVDNLLRNNVFVDLYQTVSQGIRIGEDSYSIKKVESLYREKRSTGVTTAVDSIVQYARWIESGEGCKWEQSAILAGIRDYNEDDCRSTAELAQWLHQAIIDYGISNTMPFPTVEAIAPLPLTPEILAKLETIRRLRSLGGLVALTLADLVDFHRREQKPIWWRMFDRAEAAPEELRDDPGCIQGVSAFGDAVPDKKSLIQEYRFDASQECKLSAGDNSTVMFSHNLDAKPNLLELNLATGVLRLKLGTGSINSKFDGAFPNSGSILQNEFVSQEAIANAIEEVASNHLTGTLHPSAASLLQGRPAGPPLKRVDEDLLAAAIRITASMQGECLVIQGPPGTGKTYTASRVIAALVTAGKKVGITSNSHKAVINLLKACGEALTATGLELRGIKVGDNNEDPVFKANPRLVHVKISKDARASYSSGIVAGTAWLFTLPEWEEALDVLFIDEAGQVSLANAVAMSRCAKNLVLLGDQMQLEQPIQGSHPGDAGLSSLQYALKDTSLTLPDAPIFHAVVPDNFGLFLGESRRMHPDVCTFISETIYEGRLQSHADCATQNISVSGNEGALVSKGVGIVFSGVEHDGNIQQSDEEVHRAKAIFEELLGRPHTTKNGETRPLVLSDFLFIAPYNAQVRSLQAALPTGARVGSVDKFQGQEAPVCILSLCSSFGEYGARGLGFILDRNRINVAISRAQCLAVVVADPRIAMTSAGSIEEMRLLNLFCKVTS
ncbi:TM0106 family RecB-like putative nuclease [Prosthecobacter algae]|uniref:TM0106 family RecB-like putative nuclease n=1 Tax=Prosthecobacter algae TaxID=1144682 RepID=A0ABP9P8I4_9BACT